MVYRTLIRIVMPLWRSLAARYNTTGGCCKCYICRRQFRWFLPYEGGWKNVSQFLLDVQLSGSDVANFACPFCESTDRERHLFMFFDQLGLWSSFQDANILHFAPEPHLADRIAAQHPKLYIKADLHPAMPDIHSIDVTDIHYDDNSFDVIVCNHVLEHLSNDTKGMSELYRVLRPGGWAVLQTPYSRLLQNTFCDPAIQTNQLRKRLYGQEDHVRLYGADLLSKLAQAGFDPCVKAHGDVLAGIDANIDGVNPREDLLLFTKNTVIP